MVLEDGAYNFWLRYNTRIFYFLNRYRLYWFKLLVNWFNFPKWQKRIEQFWIYFSSIFITNWWKWISCIDCFEVAFPWDALAVAKLSTLDSSSLIFCSEINSRNRKYIKGEIMHRNLFCFTQSLFYYVGRFQKLVFLTY